MNIITLGGKWIVSFDWVTTCLRSNSIESEVNFEVCLICDFVFNCNLYVSSL
jgi:hypothetical protein